MNGWMEEYIDRRMDGLINGCGDGLMGEHMDNLGGGLTGIQADQMEDELKWIHELKECVFDGLFSRRAKE